MSVQREEPGALLGRRLAVVFEDVVDHLKGGPELGLRSALGARVAAGPGTRQDLLSVLRDMRYSAMTERLEAPATSTFV